MPVTASISHCEDCRCASNRPSVLRDRNNKMPVLKYRFSLRLLAVLTLLCFFLLGGRELWLWISKSTDYIEVSVVGEGYLQCCDLDTGEVFFATHRTFCASDDGLLVSTDGRFLLTPPIVIPDRARSIRISPDGYVSYSLGRSEPRVEVGSLALCRFTNPSSLRPFADGLMRQVDTSADGDWMGRPGSDKFGTIKQHHSWR